MSEDERATRHNAQCIESYKLLESARERANHEREGGFSSKDWRECMLKEFKPRFKNNTPYEWQIDVAEALELGLDCLLIAGTGRGKTIPFPLVLMSDTTHRRKILVVVPLLLLQYDQVDRFRDMGLHAVAVNADTFNEKLKKVSFLRITTQFSLS